MQTKQPRTIAQQELDWRKNVEDRLRRLELMEALVISFVDEDTNTERLRLGQHDDGTWGYTIWDADGNVVQTKTA